MRKTEKQDEERGREKRTRDMKTERRRIRGSITKNKKKKDSMIENPPYNKQMKTKQDRQRKKYNLGS